MIKKIVRCLKLSQKSKINLEKFNQPKSLIKLAENVSQNKNVKSSENRSNQKNKILIKFSNRNFSTLEMKNKNEQKNNINFYDLFNIYKYLILSGLLSIWLIRKYFKEWRYSNLDFQDFREKVNKEEINKIILKENFSSGKFKNAEGFCLIDEKWYKIKNTNWKELYDYLKTVRQEKKDFNFIIETIRSGNLNFVNILETVNTVAFLVTLFMILKRTLKPSIPSPTALDFDLKPMNIKRVNKEKSTLRFKDVAGISEVKQEITEFVDFLKNPDKFTKMGARIPKGALLSGPPGTGKTLLAKACAGEAEVPFFFVSGSDFVEVFVGVGASRVRELFKEARKEKKAIIFIDEIDAIGKKRGGSLSSNSEGDSTLNQLLVEMDGFSESENIIVFAATNRKELLDPALTRPGRFDRLVEFNLPTLEGREEIFEVHLNKLEIGDKSENLKKYAKRLASLTPGFSGADIANICNEAAIEAVRRNNDVVTKHDFEMAVERIIGGIEKKKKNSGEEEKIVAIHESGHGVVSWFLEGASPLLKLTIIPRSKGALGFAQYLPSENSLETQIELTDRIVAILAGRIAEEEFFGEVTTGAHDDLQKAYKIAHSLVTKLGMTDSLGMVSYEEDQFGRKIYSEKISAQIDNECKKIIEKASQDCRKIIQEKKDLIQKMSEVLLEKKTIDLNDIIKVLGERPFKPKNSFKSYLEQTIKDKEEDENKKHNQEKKEKDEFDNNYFK